MTFAPADIALLSGPPVPQPNVTLALVGPHKVPSRWGFQVMSLNFPPMARRSLLCYAHVSLDTARNLALSEWSKAHGDMRSEWIALVAVESYVRSDLIAAAMVAGDPVAHVRGSYVLRRSAVERCEPPWFREGRWQGEQARDRSAELAFDMFGEIEQRRKDGESLVNQHAETAAQMVTFGIPTRGVLPLPWVVNAIMLQAPMVGTSSLVVAEGYDGVATARQTIAETVLGMNPRPAWLLFWGDDNLPPPDGVRILLDTARRGREPAVAGLYFIKSYPPAQPILWRSGHAGPLVPGVDFQDGEVLRVDGTGLDFVLIEVEALAKLPSPMFRTVLDWVPDKGMIAQTEDAFFWDRWREVHGKGPLVDTRCRVGHYSLLDGAVY